MEVIQASRHELQSRRDKILCELGMELSDLKALAIAANLRDDLSIPSDRARSWSLTKVDEVMRAAVAGRAAP
jgi:hypothetical protein